MRSGFKCGRAADYLVGAFYFCETHRQKLSRAGSAEVLAQARRDMSTYTIPTRKPGRNGVPKPRNQGERAHLRYER